MLNNVYVVVILCFALHVAAQPTLRASAGTSDTGQGEQQGAGAQKQGAGTTDKKGSGTGQGQGGNKPSKHPGTSDVVAATFNSVPLSSDPQEEKGEAKADLDKLQ